MADRNTSIRASQLRNGTVTDKDIQDSSLTGVKFVDVTISGGKIADRAISEPKLDIVNSPVDGDYLKYTTASGMGWFAGGGGASDHGALTGLADDDHTQYLLASGTRQLTGDWNIGNQKLGINMTPVYSLDVNGESGIHGNLNIGPDTGNAALRVSWFASGNRAAAIHLVSDDTYRPGFSIIRYASGSNTEATMIHRGTGDFTFNALQAADWNFFRSGVPLATFNNDGLELATSKYVRTDEVRSRDGGGLHLTDHEGNLGVHVAYSRVGIGQIAASETLAVKGNFSVERATSTKRIVLDWQTNYANYAFFNSSAWTYPMGIADTKANLGAVSFYDGWVGIGNLNFYSLEGCIGTDINEFSTDGTLGGDSDDVVPTEKAVKAYVDNNTTSGCWDRTGTIISPLTDGDTLEIPDLITAGIEWTTRSGAVDNNWTSVAYGNGLFVAVAYSGNDDRVMTSPDGVHWTTRSGTGNNNWFGVTYGNGIFVAVSSTGTGDRVMTSPDGIIWTSRTSTADVSWRSVAYGNGIFVAVSSTGTGDRVMTSPDGIIWTSRTAAAANSWQSVTYGDGLFVAVAYSGVGNRVMTSPDGINWTIRTSAADTSWIGVTYGPGLFVAVAYAGTGNRVMTSPDGITWTLRASADDNNDWRSVVYGNGIFAAVGRVGDDRVMTSPDGIIWMSRTHAATNDWHGITYGNAIFVAVSYTGTNNRVMTSGKTEITKVHETGNAFKIKGRNISETDVPTDGQVISWNAGNSEWEYTTTSGGGSSDHGLLTGLADDDHSQYLLTDGTRTVTGDFTVSGSINIYDTKQYKINGVQALKLIGTGNIFSGQGAGNSITTGANNIAIGSDSLATVSGASNSLAIGHNALKSCVVGGNISIGAYSGVLLVDGQYNTIVGISAASGFSSGDRNTAMGYMAGNGLLTGNDNVYVGYQSGSIGNGSSGNTFVGAWTGRSITGGNNVGIGYMALYASTSGYSNVAIGQNAMISATGGYQNIAIGRYALQYNKNGDNNVVVGHQAGTGVSDIDCGNNTIIGYQAGYTISGTGNVFLGHQSGYSETGSNKLYIENSNSTSPLIYGEFDNNLVKINGTLQLPNGTSINEFSTDTTLSGNSDDAVPTEKAVKTYVDSATGNSSGCRVYRSTAQSIPGATWTKVQFDTEDYDNQNEYDNSVNYRFTAKIAGVYQVSATVIYTGAAANTRTLTNIWKNGANFAAGNDSSSVSTSQGQTVGVPIKLEVGDYIEIYTYQSSGSAVNTYTSNNCFLVVQKMTAASEHGSAHENSSYAKVSCVRSVGNHDGTFTQDAWRTRTLNTEDNDPDAVLSLSSNQITLAAGTYECRIVCPAVQVAYHKARLYNTTGAETLILGTVSYGSNNALYSQIDSEISGRFTIAASQVLEVQHYCTVTRATYGFGAAGGCGVDEVYTVAEFWKISEDGSGSGSGFSSRVSAHRTASQTINSGSFTKVQLNTEAYDGLSEFDKVTNYRFTANSAGYYMAVAQVASNGSVPDQSRCIARIYKNGSVAASQDVTTSSAAGAYLAINVSKIVYLAANEYLELYFYQLQPTPATMNIVNVSGDTFLTVHRLS